MLNRSFGVASARTDGFREDSGLADALVDDVMHVAVDPESEPIVAEEGVEIRREVEVEGVAPKLGGMQRELGAWWVTGDVRLAGLLGALGRALGASVARRSRRS